MIVWDVNDRAGPSKAPELFFVLFFRDALHHGLGEEGWCHTSSSASLPLTSSHSAPLPVTLTGAAPKPANSSLLSRVCLSYNKKKVRQEKCLFLFICETCVQLFFYTILTWFLRISIIVLYMIHLCENNHLFSRFSSFFIICKWQKCAGIVRHIKYIAASYNYILY